jgi:hypothetical protein
MDDKTQSVEQQAMVADQLKMIAEDKKQKEAEKIEL